MSTREWSSKCVKWQRTSDHTYRLGDAAVDARFDCELDGSCVCLKGHQGPACEIECKSTAAFDYQVQL
jgi:hypothetical protein